MSQIQMEEVVGDTRMDREEEFKFGGKRSWESGWDASRDVELSSNSFQKVPSNFFPWSSVSVERPCSAGGFPRFRLLAQTGSGPVEPQWGSFESRAVPHSVHPRHRLLQSLGVAECRTPDLITAHASLYL
jgi:hypothetical protein